MPHIGVVDGQKAQLDTNKHVMQDGMMMLVIGLERSANYGRSGNRETQVKRDI